MVFLNLLRIVGLGPKPNSMILENHPSKVHIPDPYPLVLSLNHTTLVEMLRHILNAKTGFTPNPNN
jgi:hypothetical protein